MRKALVVLVFFLGCAQYPPPVVPPHTPTGDCSDGLGYSDSGNGALVCVNRDGSGKLSANPDSVEVTSGHDITIMLSDKRGELDVHFPHDAKLYNFRHGCSGNPDPTFKATAKKVAQKTKRYKYRVIDRNDESQQDPDVMIDPAP